MDKELINLIEDNGLTLHGDIEHFAHLVAEREREACARVCEAFINGSAGLVDNTAQVCAEAIRARGGE